MNISLKLIKYESKVRDLSNFFYLQGFIHRDPEDGFMKIAVLYKIKIVDKDKNIIGIREVITSYGDEIGQVFYNDTIMILY